jgi:hypothetical protein
MRRKDFQDIRRAVIRLMLILCEEMSTSCDQKRDIQLATTNATPHVTLGLSLPLRMLII